MSDLIRIVDLEVWTHIGVPDEERVAEQRLLISAEMWVQDFTRAAESDDVAHTVNYYDVAQLIKKTTRSHPRKLLETLISDLAETVLSHFPVEQVRLEIKKMIIPESRYVAVEILRSTPKQEQILL